MSDQQTFIIESPWMLLTMLFVNQLGIGHDIYTYRGAFKSSHNIVRAQNATITLRNHRSERRLIAILGNVGKETSIG